MKQLILNVPHSAINIPLKNGYIISDDLIDSEILQLTDWHTEDLFHSDNDIMVIADFSRIICDTERFADDSQEVMAQFGMGVLYEKTDTGKVMRIISPELRERILNEYYWKHHESLSQAVKNQLSLFSQAIIIDCHSFPDITLQRSLYKEPYRPDFNIGTDPFHTPKKLIDLSIEFFEEKGYSLGIDFPFSGSIVPLEYYQKQKGVQSIMLEINRKLYLKEGSSEKSDGYDEIKKVTNDFIEAVRSCL